MIFYSKIFLFYVSFYPYYKLENRQQQILSPFYSSENWGEEKVSAFHYVVQLIWLRLDMFYRFPLCHTSSSGASLIVGGFSIIVYFEL